MCVVLSSPSVERNIDVKASVSVPCGKFLSLASVRAHAGVGSARGRGAGLGRDTKLLLHFFSTLIFRFGKAVTTLYD